MNQIPKELCDLISDFAELTEKEWFVSRLRYILPYALNKSTQITIYKSDVEKWVLSSFPPMLHTTTDVLLVYEFENGQKRIEDSVFLPIFGNLENDIENVLFHMHTPYKTGIVSEFDIERPEILASFSEDIFVGIRPHLFRII